MCSDRNFMYGASIKTRTHMNILLGEKKVVSVIPIYLKNCKKLGAKSLTKN